MNIFKKLRKENGLTQIELASKLNIKQSTICKWETGVSFPDISTLKELAEFYKIDISTIINNAENLSRYQYHQNNFLENIKIDDNDQRAILSYLSLNDDLKEKASIYINTLADVNKDFILKKIK